MPEQILFTKEKGSLFKVKVWMKLLVKKSTPCYGNKNRNRNWLSGWENLPELLLGYHQYHDGDNEYSYCNLLRKMDKINHSDEPYSTVTSCARGLYRNPMLCERLAGETRILLKQKENRNIL